MKSDHFNENWAILVKSPLISNRQKILSNSILESPSHKISESVSISHIPTQYFIKDSFQYGQKQHFCTLIGTRPNNAFKSVNIHPNQSFNNLFCRKNIRQLYYVFGLKIGCLLLFLLVKKLIFNSNQKTSNIHQIGPKLLKQKIYSILVSEESPWNLAKNGFWIMKIGQLVQKIWPKNRKKINFLKIDVFWRIFFRLVYIAATEPGNHTFLCLSYALMYSKKKSIFFEFTYRRKIK